MKYYEFRESEDLYEDEELVLMKTTFNELGKIVQHIDIGFKGADGDIERYVTVKTKVIQEKEFDDIAYY
ncbi:MAG: hypothetical protein PUE08_05735 [Eubacteriales bacterium]|nr:hypothetical protein [Eubacteriales bacterium]